MSDKRLWKRKHEEVKKSLTTLFSGIVDTAGLRVRGVNGTSGSNGAGLGCDVGEEEVGAEVGLEYGAAVDGSGLGEFEGEAVGCLVGAIVGVLDGGFEGGRVVGIKEGVDDGEPVIIISETGADGPDDGDSDKAKLGNSVGSGVGGDVVGP